jgi:adenosine deaminase
MDTARLKKMMRNFPKIDLHRHLEGSVTPETLLYLARTFGGDLPTYELESLRSCIEMTNDTPGFENFLSKFNVYRGFYTCREAIEYAACQAVSTAAADNVKYLELRYSPTHFAGGRFCELDVVEWIHGALQRTARSCGIIVTPILTISRNYGLDLASQTVDLALSLPDGYFCGLDIAGDEISNSAEPFANLFEKFRARGLGLSLHAGEACGAENVRQAVETFNANRIGHGIRAAEDPATMRLLCERDVLLEVCLTSNVHTGVVPSINAHPITTLMSHNVPVCLNTDDPAISAITLSDEYHCAVAELGLNVDVLKGLNRAALRHAFHPDPAWLEKKIGHYWQ